jgi:hypothetical protein
VDELLRIQLQAFLPCAPVSEEPEGLNVDETLRLMRIWFPAITRERVRALLFRTERSGLACRQRRGTYVPNEWGYARPLEEELDYGDESIWKWKQRRLRSAYALVVHYVLPWVPVYRKALEMGLSDRSFHYALNDALDDLDTGLLEQIRFRKMCSAN